MHHNLPGGTSVLVDAGRGPGGRLRTSCVVTAVRQGEGVAEVEWAEGDAMRRARCTQVIVAVPAVSSAGGRHRWQPVLEQPVGRVHLAGDCLGVRAGMDTAADTGYEAASRIMAVLGPALG
jgi:hypothetical protein